MSPAVSVLLPCYNAAAHLAQCLESLLSQSFIDFEIVAVDDGSEDETPDLLEKRAGEDSRLRVLHRPHRGIAAALMAATREARAGLLARMDADDRCRSDRLECQVRFLSDHAEVDVLGSRIRMFPRPQLTDGLLRYESWVNRLLTHEEIVRDLFVESPIPHPSVMMRKDRLEEVGGYRDVGWPEDYDLWMRMARAGARFAKLPEVLLEWRDRPERASRKDERFSDESFQGLKEHYLLDTFLAERTEVVIWGAGPVGKRWSHRIRERGLKVGYFVDLDPRKIGKRIHGALVIAASDIAQLRGHFVLVAVGALSRQRHASEDPWLPAREEVRDQLARAGFEDGRDFVCIA